MPGGLENISEVLQLDNLLAVLVGALAAIIPITIQLRHDARQRERERQLNLRRDIYLEVAEAMGRIQELLSSFPRLDLEFKDLIALTRGVPASLNKFHVVATNQTLVAFVGYLSSLSGHNTELLIRRAHLEEIRTEIQRLEDQIASLVAEQSNVISYIKFVIKTDQAGSVKRYSEIASELEKNRAKLTHEQERQASAIQELAAAALRAIQIGTMELAKINILIRRELELQLDEEKYLQLMADALQENTTEVDGSD